MIGSLMEVSICHPGKHVTIELKDVHAHFVYTVCDTATQLEYVTCPYRRLVRTKQRRNGGNGWGFVAKIDEDVCL